MDYFFPKMIINEHVFYSQVEYNKSLSLIIEYMQMSNQIIVMFHRMTKLVSVIFTVILWYVFYISIYFCIVIKYQTPQIAIICTLVQQLQLKLIAPLCCILIKGTKNLCSHNFYTGDATLAQNLCSHNFDLGDATSLKFFAPITLTPVMQLQLKIIAIITFILVIQLQLKIFAPIILIPVMQLQLKIFDP